MRLSNYKTDKQKRDHINRYWNKESLFDVLEAYLAPYVDEEECKKYEPENYEIWQDIKNNLKTKKAVLEKYLDVAWDIICEEYSYA